MVLHACFLAMHAALCPGMLCNLSGHAHVQVATNDGSEYNVGTMIDNFVYNTVATWYNEDGGDNGNSTLPLTPSVGTPGSPTQSNSGLKNLKISTPWVVAVIAAGVLVKCHPDRQTTRRAAGPNQTAEHVHACI